MATKRDTVEKCIVPYRREMHPKFCMQTHNDKIFKISHFDKIGEA